MKIIQKKIELQKLEVDLSERALKLRDQELQERERRVQPQLTETVTTPTIPQAASAAAEPVKDEAKIPQEQPMDTAPVEETKLVRWADRCLFLSFFEGSVTRDRIGSLFDSKGDECELQITRLWLEALLPFAL